MADLQGRCRCCSIPVEGMRAQVRVCPLCDQCGGIHGEALAAAVRERVAAGKLSVWYGIGVLALDDANTAGMLQFVGDPRNASLWVPEPVRRWQVVAGRAVLANTLPAMDEIIGACLAPFLGTVATEASLQALADEITTAMRWIDPDVLHVDIASKRDAIDPEHLIIKVTTRTAAMPGMVSQFGAEDDVSIPDSVMRAKPAQA